MTLAILLLISVGLYLLDKGPKHYSSNGVFTSEGQSADSGPEPPKVPDIVMKAETGRVAVIMFHNVVAKPKVWFDCTIDEFKKDLDEIAKGGFTVLTLDHLYNHLTSGAPVPPKSVVLTFDDNYQGVYDNVVPLLRERKWPAAVFVHTKYVGVQAGWPKMTWEELAELHKEGLVTIGAHTVSHPMNLKDLPGDQQRTELAESKKTLEDHLGGEIPYMAYPDGSNDITTQQIAREVGYKMSFTMDPTPAEGSPNILCVGRYEAKKFSKALEGEMDELQNAPVAIGEVALRRPGPVTAEAGKYDGTKMVLLKGGTPVSILASGRRTVGDFVAQNEAVAGVNGTFFVMAAIASDDNSLIGPSRPQRPGVFTPDTNQFRLTKLVDRPMVVWGPTRFAIVPFQPGPMNQETLFKDFMPDYTDAFLAGAWLVHEGKPRTQDEMHDYASQDITDPRKRIFFGVTKDGDFITGASQGSITTETLARAAAATGAYEAVLLDSGFSTSVVFDGRILVTGHSAIDNPSRPVPHAIVFQGVKGAMNIGDLETVPAVLTPAVPPGTAVAGDLEEQNPKPMRRHRRRRRR